MFYSPLHADMDDPREELARDLLELEGLRKTDASRLHPNHQHLAQLSEPEWERYKAAVRESYASSIEEWDRKRAAIKANSS